MASFMFFGFLTAQKPHYEDRLDNETEAPRLKALWRDMEERCFDKYLSEVNDDQKGIHVYQLLKHEVAQCKMLMQTDNRREVMQECTMKLVSLNRRCMSTAEETGGRASLRAAMDRR
mmetsp:Transcript_101269/g.325456  ORF Transcript_101269/g.325456 Transcript_101269/m.325456 type:complete len:117 (-) Transcript_101269:73-423(-)